MQQANIILNNNTIPTTKLKIPTFFPEDLIKSAIFEAQASEGFPLLTLDHK